MGDRIIRRSKYDGNSRKRQLIWRDISMYGPSAYYKDTFNPWLSGTKETQPMIVKHPSSPGSNGGEVEIPKSPGLYTLCSPDISSTGSTGGEALRSMLSDIDLDDYCSGGPSSSGTEEEPKIDTPFYEGPNSPGSKGSKVKRCKWSDMVIDGPCKSYEGPSSPGMKAKEPNFDTFHFVKLPMSTGLMETVFESAAR